MTTQKHNILPVILLLAVTLFSLLTSCSDDSPDLRDKITGNYSYTVKIYIQDGDSLIYMGNKENYYDITGTMKVRKNSGDDDALDFYDGDIVMFNGINLRDAGNVIVFDVPDQEAWIGPANVQIVGYNYWDFNSESYHGAFIYDDKSVEIAFTARVMDVDTGLVMILTAFPE
jgi:hypothetical protein